MGLIRRGRRTNRTIRDSSTAVPVEDALLRLQHEVGHDEGREEKMGRGGWLLEKWSREE
jgi:hypothetical protein